MSGRRGPLLLVTYTTRYRDGGAELAVAARTLARRRQQKLGLPDDQVRVVATESKAAFVEAFRAMAPLRELHFVGHSGMYGPMFRTAAMPEQLSPHEWRELSAELEGRGGAFVEGGEAAFHACRTGRWFAPFFARTFGAPASGYHWYTTFSRRPDRFVWPGLQPASRPELHLVGCKGRKSHGLLGSVAKYAVGHVEPLKRFDPAALGDPDRSYDGVAELYADVFEDIGVREVEVDWLEAHLPAPTAGGAGLRLVDLGCGPGSLLRRWAPRLCWGLGVDASAAMVRLATARSQGHPQLRFAKVTGPTIPAADQSVDVVVSMLSWRYLDWDPMLAEVRRVLRPGGRLLIVDMATVPLAASEVPRFVRDRARTRLGRARNRRYEAALQRLVADPRWGEMLRHNPIRARHEYVWFLESRFPGRTVETLDVGFHARVLAFDSGPLDPLEAGEAPAPQRYP